MQTFRFAFVGCFFLKEYLFRQVSEATLSSAGQIESLTPQLVNAGRIRMVYPENKAADEHFENLRRQGWKLMSCVLLMSGVVKKNSQPAPMIGCKGVNNPL